MSEIFEWQTYNNEFAKHRNITGISTGILNVSLSKTQGEATSVSVKSFGFF